MGVDIVSAKMEFYVAGRFSRKEEVREVYKLLKEKGHKITADWTLHRSIQPYEQNQETASEFAVEDLEGVLKADVFMLLADAEKSTGVYVELGAAITSFVVTGKPIVYVVDESPSLFVYHPAVRRKRSVEEVLNEVMDVK